MATGKESFEDTSKMGNREASAAGTVKDPVCGMEVDPNTATHRADHNGNEYFFCSDHCLEKFRAEPAKVLASSSHDRTTEGGVYTCAMDPEVRESKPGACPKCGMSLEAPISLVPTTKTD